jgi:hypothetical protein
MSFYATGAQLDDIIYGNEIKGRVEIQKFLAWNNDDFKVLSGSNILTITKQTVGKNNAITEGVFHKFSYGGKKLGPWLFVIIQEFDSSNKIIKQTDWINYTPRENFMGGKNMNKQLVSNL